ncbi:ABC transporter ATP-binding protein [Nonomuraea typhae]|uniref:ABC transporter ATP-binding protein n=1 Tax=Nonomuraea typhae TaxID=2603600 RepID=A0ABW7Z312_9ACTN
MVSPTSGVALVGGTPYTRLPDPVTQVGAVLEATAFHPGLSARAHLDVLRTAARLAPSRVAEVLERVDLAGAADQRVGRFSLGMRQRLAIAGALLGDPGTLVLDEPANGLDPQGIHWLRGFLRAHAHEGRAVLVSTHVLAEIERIADHALILSAGRLVRRADLTPGATDLEDVYLEATRCSR